MNKKKPNNQQQNSQPWLITFADLIMVILIMFVLLYSYSNTDMEKFDSVIHSFQKHSSILDGGSGSEESGSGFAGDEEQGESCTENEEQDELDGENEEKVTVSKEHEDLLAEMIKRENSIQEIMDYVQLYAEERGLEEKLTVSPTEKGIEVVLPEMMLFPSGQSDLIDEAMVFLDDMSPMLSEISNYVEVEGHTDNRPISTYRFPSNWDLSTARANEVIRYLVEEHGISPERFKSIGYGEHDPIASNDSNDGRSKNRRVVIIILNEYIDS